MEVYMEPLEGAPHLYLVGGGHVAYHLGRLAATVGYRIHVLDDREKFANAERFPEAVEVAVDNIPEWLTRAPIPPNAYVVILTRGHRYDLDALRALATRELRYLGLIGSRAKVARLHEALRDEGVAISNPDGLHAPVGLDIGAVSPQEIAVSILAELIAVKYGKLDHDEAARDTRVRCLRWLPQAAAAPTAAAPAAATAES